MKKKERRQVFLRSFLNAVSARNSRRLVAAGRDLAALLCTWTRPRLIHLLLKLADNLGESETDDVLIRVPVTHETQASMIGASRVRVTSTLNQLQREGLLGKRGRLMVVRPDRPRNSLVHKAA